MPSRRSFLSLVTAAAAWRSLAARAQERFSPFVGSNPETVRRMVELAAPRSGETVIDLGSGDGRIVFAALEGRPGVNGVGVDIDADLVKKANAAAKAQGVDITMDARLLHVFSRLLQEQVAKTEWDLNLALYEGEPQAEPATAPVARKLN